jgi:hypothetical protein
MIVGIDPGLSGVMFFIAAIDAPIVAGGFK